jgi:hypothetical protein
MIVPFPIYVDEISSDKVKATVSNGITIFYNLKTMALDMPAHHLKHLYTLKKGIFIVPIGRFICMLLRNGGNGGMIILDLLDKEELATQIAQKLNDEVFEAQFMFMKVFAEIKKHPEKHHRFKLVVGTTAHLRY